MFEIITFQGLDNSIRHNNLSFFRTNLDNDHKYTFVFWHVIAHVCAKELLQFPPLAECPGSISYSFQNAALLFLIPAPSFHLRFCWKPLRCISHIPSLNERAVGLHECYGMHLTCHRNKVILRPGWHGLIPMTFITYYRNMPVKKLRWDHGLAHTLGKVCALCSRHLLAICKRVSSLPMNCWPKHCCAAFPCRTSCLRKRLEGKKRNCVR